MFIKNRAASSQNNEDFNFVGDLYGELHLFAQREHRAKWFDIRPFLPGLMACGTAAAAAAWLAEQYDFPIMLLGLLIGASLNFISGEARALPGLEFASGRLLQIGIVLLGFQVTFAQIALLGPLPFAALIATMVVTGGAGLAASRLAGGTPEQGLLAGGATAICGASAAFAIYNVMDKRRVEPSQLALTLAAISIASAVAMSVYPLLATQFHLSDTEAGFLIGASVHDVAQAIGGGYAFSDDAGRYATIVKLSRVALLAPVLIVAAWLLNTSNARERPAYRRVVPPWFITGFMVSMVVNSAVAIPDGLSGDLLSCAKALLLIAITATAMRTRLDMLMTVGWRAFLPVLSATIASFATALLLSIYLL